MTVDDLLKPEVLLTLDVAVLAALTVAILVGLRLGRRLKALRQTHGEWNREMATFAERADAAEAGLERLRTALIAEAHHRRDLDNAADRAAAAAPKLTPAALKPELEPEPKPEPKLEPKLMGNSRRVNRPGRAEAVLSMQ